VRAKIAQKAEANGSCLSLDLCRPTIASTQRSADTPFNPLALTASTICQSADLREVDPTRT